MKQLWVEQYRPKSKDDYVFKDDKQRKQIDNWLKGGALHRYTPFFLNFNIEYSGFYSSLYSGKCYILQNNVLPPFYLCICTFTYNVL